MHENFVLRRSMLEGRTRSEHYEQHTACAEHVSRCAFVLEIVQDLGRHVANGSALCLEVTFVVSSSSYSCEAEVGYFQVSLGIHE